MNTQLKFSLVWICVLCVAPSGFADPPHRAKSFLDFGDTYGFGMNMSIPARGLGLETIERWADILNASETQRRFMLVEYEHFVERNNAFVDREAPDYIDMGKEMWETRQQRNHYTWEYYELGRKVDRASARLRRELTAMEQALIDAIEPVLTREQRARLPIVRNEATRRNCRVDMLTNMRWADVELRDVWDEAGAEFATPEEQRRVDEIFTNYEARLTELMCRMADFQLKMRGELTASGIARNRREISSAEGRARSQQVRENRLQIDRRVRILNEQTVERIAAAISAEPSTAFVDAAKAAAFPELYPDDTVLHELFVAVINDELLNERQRRMVTALKTEYLAQYDQECRKLETFCIEWAEGHILDMSNYLTQHFPEALEPMLEERAELSQRWLMTLRDTLGAEAIERHAALIPEALREREQETVTP